METFTDIIGFPDYMIGDYGTVYSKKSNRVLKGSMGKGRNRPLINLMRDGKSVQHKIHQLVAIHFLPPPGPLDTCVRHLNDDPTDNRVSNLAWGTHADNMRDKVRNGKSGKGAKNGNCKLSEEQAREIVSSTLTTQELADTFSVSPAQIRRIKRGQRWSHLGQENQHTN
jgi:hypothetical protein